MKKLTLFLPLFSFFFFSPPLLRANTELLLRQLSEVNAEWNKQVDINSVLQASFTAPASYHGWIAAHLMLVEETLRARDISGLSVSQRYNRSRLLDELKKYYAANTFPINDYLPYKSPVFIDRKGTHCAVGYLMRQSGSDELAQKINAAEKFAYVHQIRTTGVREWADNNGFTIDELAWIQPGYGGCMTSNLAAHAGNDASFCAGSSTCVTIGGTPTATGGMPPYAYAWSSVPGGFISNAALSTVCPAVTTTYYVTVSDAEGCIANDNMTVTVHPAVIANAGPDTTVCQGCDVLIGGNPTASGGTPPFTYNWSPPNFLDNRFISNPTAVDVLLDIVYTVTVTDSFGCTASNAVLITAIQSGVADAGPDQIMVDCPGSFVTLGGTPSGNYCYQWFPCLPQMSSCTNLNPVITGLDSTTIFTLVITDCIGGFVDSDHVTVLVVNSTLTANAGNDVAFCSGSGTCVTLGGSPTASGGTFPMTYQWSSVPPSIIQNIPNPVVCPTVTTIYYLLINDGSGCTARDTVIITVNSRPVFYAGPDTIACAGNVCMALGNPQGATGGTPPYTYSWSSGVVPNNVPNPIGCTTGIGFTVTVFDSLGCSNTDNVNLIRRTSPTADAGPGGVMVACTGDCFIPGGNPTATGTQGPYTYEWSPCGLLADTSSCTMANPSVCNLGFSPQICVTVTDVFGCTASDCAFIQVVPNTLFVNAGADVQLCAPGCVTLGGTPTVTGGIPPYHYEWHCVGYPSDSISNPVVCFDTTTICTVVVTDDHNCSAADLVNVFVHDSVVASIIGLDSQYCINASNVPITGSPPGGLCYMDGSPISCVFSPAQAGIGNHTVCYVVCVSGCCDTVCQSVRINPIPQVSVTGYIPSYCSYEDCDTLIGSPPGGVFNPPLPDNVFCPASANSGINNITYTYTDSATGCSNSTNITIVVRPAPTFSVTVSDDTVCAGQSDTLCPSYSIEVINLQYAQLGGNILASGLNCITFAPAGVDYCVVASAISSNGCVNRDTICIYVNPQASIGSIVSDNVSCFEGEDGSACVFVSSGTPPYIFNWSNGQTGVCNSNIAADLYLVTVTDAAGCTTMDFVNVTAPSQIDSSYSVTICSDSSYSFNGQSLTSPGTYLDTLVAANGCDSIVTLVLSVTQCTGIAEINDDSGITLYPNPATDELFIDSRGLAISAINIYNAIGSLANRTKQVLNNHIDISHLASGVYITEVVMPNTIVRKRWVKM